MTVTPVPGGGFGEAARDRQLSCFRHSVMNHFLRNLKSGFAGDKHNAAPIVLFHRADVVPAEPHAAQHVHFEEASPIVIGDLGECFRLEDPEIVYQDVHLRKLRDELACSGFSCEIRRDSMSGAAALDRGADPLFRSPVYDDGSAFFRERLRDRQSNTGGGAGYECGFAFEFEIHASVGCRRLAQVKFP